MEEELRCHDCAGLLLCKADEARQLTSFYTRPDGKRVAEEQLLCEGCYQAWKKSCKGARGVKEGKGLLKL